MLDRNKIPEFIDGIVTDYLMKLEYIDYDSAYCNVMFWLSVMLCSCRVKITEPRRKIDMFPNLYIMKFGGIGIGKGRTSNTVMGLFEKWRDSMEFRESEFRKSEESAIRGSAAVQGIKNEARKYELIDRMMPAVMMPIITSAATAEGVMMQRGVMDKAGFGCMYWIENEIYDMMEKCYPGTRQWDIMTIMKEVYDNGFIDPKLIAGNKKLRKTGAIPHCAFLQGAIDDEKGSEPVLRFFKMGMARRFLVCTEKKFQVIDKRSIESINRLIAEANEAEPDIKLFLKELYDRVRNGIDYTFSDKLTDIYEGHKEDCRVEGIKTGRIAGGSLKEHIANKSWNTLKISAIYEAVNSFKHTISAKSYEQAIYATDYFTDDFREFCGAGVRTAGRSLYEAILSEGPKPTSFFIALPLFPKNRNKGFKLFHETLEDVEMIVSENNQLLVKDEKHKRNIKWSIIDKPEHYDIIDEVYSKNKDQKMIDSLVEAYGQEAVEQYLKLNQK